MKFLKNIIGVAKADPVSAAVNDSSSETPNANTAEPEKELDAKLKEKGLNPPKFDPEAFKEENSMDTVSPAEQNPETQKTDASVQDKKADETDVNENVENSAETPAEESSDNSAMKVVQSDNVDAKDNSAETPATTDSSKVMEEKENMVEEVPKPPIEMNPHTVSMHHLREETKNIVNSEANRIIDSVLKNINEMKDDMSKRIDMVERRVKYVQAKTMEISKENAARPPEVESRSFVGLGKETLSVDPAINGALPRVSSSFRSILKKTDSFDAPENTMEVKYDLDLQLSHQFMDSLLMQVGYAIKKEFPEIHSRLMKSIENEILLHGKAVLENAHINLIKATEGEEATETDVAYNMAVDAVADDIMDIKEKQQDVYAQDDSVSMSDNVNSHNSTSEVVEKEHDDDTFDTNYFFLADGTYLKDVNELYEALLEMDESLYERHANEFKNDFATWVEHVYNEHYLGDNLRNCLDKFQALHILHEWLVEKGMMPKKMESKVVS